MMVRKGFAGAAVAALAVSSSAWAANAAPATADQAFAGSSSALSMAPVYADDTTSPLPDAATAAPAATPKPLMNLLGQTPVGKFLNDAGVSIFGFGEAGYFYNLSAPRLAEQPTFIAFPGLFSNRILLDQADVQVQRNVDTTKNKVDIGFEFENMYGTDASFIHSNGILDNRPPKHPQNQYDITQAYLTLFLPVGNGLTITAGKFVTLLGYEYINPTQNSLYTHSYIFSSGEPGTQTGILGTYKLNDQWTVEGGITRGWDQSSKDINGDPDFLGEVTYTPNKDWTFIGNVSEGPQQFHDNSDWRTAVELIAQYTASDELKLGFDGLYADDPHGAGTFTSTGTRKSAQWYGGALYASYKLAPQAMLNARAEAFRDNDGARTGTRANYYEATLGVALTPFPDNAILQYLQVRPEVRYDLSDKSVYDRSTSARGKYTEFTAAVDAIMQF